MRDKDKHIFCSVAKDHGVWILVRELNFYSERFINIPGFLSKPFECKPKTADRFGRDKETGKQYDIRGLVVSAEIWPDVYNEADNKNQKALDEWKKFARAYGLENKKRQGFDGYEVETDKSSFYYGCVKREGSYIFGDYDLFDIVIEKHAIRNLYLVDTKLSREINRDSGISEKVLIRHNAGPKFWTVSKAINVALGINDASGVMIHHGSEAQYGGSFQSVHSFSPHGFYEYWTKARTEEMYKKWKRFMANDSDQPLFNSR